MHSSLDCLFSGCHSNALGSLLVLNMAFDPAAFISSECVTGGQSDGGRLNTKRNNRFNMSSMTKGLVCALLFAALCLLRPAQCKLLDFRDFVVSLFQNADLLIVDAGLPPVARYVSLVAYPNQGKNSTLFDFLPFVFTWLLYLLLFVRIDHHFAAL
jgi:hypothetical protein